MQRRLRREQDGYHRIGGGCRDIVGRNTGKWSVLTLAFTLGLKCSAEAEKEWELEIRKLTTGDQTRLRIKMPLAGLAYIRFQVS